MKFIADSMLGRLAKWLRILGYDTLYYPDIDDSVVLRIAREDKRTLLTRDKRLIKIRGITNFVFIHDDRPFDQLRQLFKSGVINDFSSFLSRCVHCNTVLERVLAEDVEGSVPDFVLWGSDIMKRCPDCGNIYWKGTHPDKIRERLKEVLSA